MQAELIEDIGADTRRKERRRKDPPPKPLLDSARNSALEGTALTGHLAADLAGGLIEAFARDYSERW